MYGVNGIEDKNLFAIWVSGYCAATAFALFLLWFFDRKQGR